MKSQKSSLYFTTPPIKENTERRKMILEILAACDVSYESLAEILSEKGIKTSIPSLKKDIASLRDDLYDIHSRKHLLHLSSDNSVSSVLSIFASDPDTELFIWDLQFRVILLLCLNTQLNYKSIQEFLDNYISEYADKKYSKFLIYDSAFIASCLESNSLTDFKLRRYITGPMVESHLISYNPHNWFYQNTSDVHLIHIGNDNTQLINLLSKKRILPKKVADYAVKALSENSFTNKDASRNIFYKISDFMDTVSALDYENNPISFQYASKGDRYISYPQFYIGIIAYSVDKDELYIIGSPSLNQSKKKMLALSKIIQDSIRSSSAANNDEAKMLRRSKNDEYLDITNQMFDISCDPSQNITLKVNYNDRNFNEFDYLSKRRNATAALEVLEEESGKYLKYSDTIRGLGDFAKYLRQFGTDVTVLDNSKLKKQLRDSAREVLANYDIDTENIYD